MPSPQRQSRKSVGFTLVELLVVIAVIGILVALTMPAVQQARAAARRSTCQNQLKQLGLALHNYHEVARMLPAGAYIKGSAFPAQTGWGWGAMILPYIDQANLYQQVDFNLPTTVGTNVVTIRSPVPIWRCPSDPAAAAFEASVPWSSPLTVAAGNYCGSEGMLKGMSRIKFGDVTDGLSNTLLLGERGTDDDGGPSGPFTAGWYGFLASSSENVFTSIPYSAATPQHTINLINPSGSNFSSYHTGGAQFTFGDGSVKFLSENMDGDTFAALGTRNGGEVVEF